MNFYKKIKPLFLLLFISILFPFFSVNSFAETTDSPPLTFDYIYDSLNPFGTWYDIDTHGWVWQPNCMSDSWQPYTLGRWELTEEGWLWESNFDWGWLTFHYGKWFRHNRIGWCWVPDYDWAPAWVVWYWTAHYVGWSPIPPVPPGESYEIQPEDWFFVSIVDFLSPYLYNYRINSSIISPEICGPYIEENDYYFNDCCFYYYDKCDKIWIGPPCLIVEKNVKRKLNKQKVVEIKKKIPREKRSKKNVVEIYRPKKRKSITKKIDQKNDANKRKSILKPKEKNTDANDLPVTPIKTKPRKKQRSKPPSSPSTPHTRKPVPVIRTIRPIPVPSRTKPQLPQEQIIVNPPFNR